MIIVATDAPPRDRNLERLAKRAIAGLARTGATMTNGSGDYGIAFSTAESVRRRSDADVNEVREFADEAISPLFQPLRKLRKRRSIIRCCRQRTCPGTGARSRRCRSTK